MAQNDAQYILFQQSVQQNFDAKKFYFGPWINAPRGGACNNVLIPAAINAFKMLSDSHASFYEHIVMSNAVGCPGGDAHPAGAGLQAIGYQSARAHTKRNIKGIAIVKSHFGYEKRVDLEIDEKLLTLIGTPTLFAVQAANNAIAAAVANNAAVAAGGAGVAIAVPVAAVGAPGVMPIDFVHQIWVWLVTDRCQHRSSPLLTANQNTQMERFNITDVGVNRNTLELAHHALTQLNSQRSVPYADEAMYVKFV